MGLTHYFKRLQHIFYNRIYDINGKKRMLNYYGMNYHSIEVWYESENVKSFIEHMPYKESIAPIFGGYSHVNGKQVRFLFVLDEWKTNDNWYYPDDQVWAITVRALVETLMDILQNNQKDVEPLLSYCTKQGLLKKKDVRK